MNIYEITKRDLRDRNFAFKDETEFLGKDFENQYFIFNGLLFYICISGTAKIKINYKEYQVTADDMFIIPPKHICSIYGCSPGFKVRLILISLDFLCSMPVTPNFDLFQKALLCSARKMIPTYLLCDCKEDKDVLPKNISVMGCRTRVVDDLFGERSSIGRGNIDNISINLPRLALEVATQCKRLEASEKRE